MIIFWTNFGQGQWGWQAAPLLFLAPVILNVILPAIFSFLVRVFRGLGNLVENYSPVLSHILTFRTPLFCLHEAVG